MNNNKIRRNNRGTFARQGRPQRQNRTKQVKSEVGIIHTKNNPRQNFIQPEFRMQKFKWFADYGNITNSGSSYAGKMMYANNLYDPDPALLTSSVSGFADNMDFYFYCLPISYSTRVIITNKEAFPVKAALLFSVQQADLLFSSTQNIIDLGENPISTNWVEIAAAGGQDRATLSLRDINLAKANGNELEYYGSAETYSNQPTSGPPYPMFCSLLVWSTSNFTSAGVGVAWQSRWTCKLWARRLILDSGPTVARKQLVFELAAQKKKLDELVNVVKLLDNGISTSSLDDIQKKIGDLELGIAKNELLLTDPYRGQT